MRRPPPTETQAETIEAAVDQPVIRSTVERFVYAVDRTDHGVTGHVGLHLAGRERLADVDRLKEDDGLRRLWPVLGQVSSRSALGFLLRFDDPTQERAMLGRGAVRARGPHGPQRGAAVPVPGHQAAAEAAPAGALRAGAATGVRGGGDESRGPWRRTDPVASREVRHRRARPRLDQA